MSEFADIAAAIVRRMKSGLCMNASNGFVVDAVLSVLQVACQCRSCVSHAADYAMPAALLHLATSLF
jgi:hypothetical protein